MDVGPFSAVQLTELAAALDGRYRLERTLGAGGMATVWLAEDVRHRRRVAIKVLHPELSAVVGPERFLREIELTAKLQHPHILPLFDSASAHGLLYYVMPFVEGETLRRRLQRERQLPVGDTIRIATEIADALEYAHRHGIVHRDVKPDNVLLQDGHALVADFGIALAVQQANDARMTQTGLSLGSPQYMAPEQAAGDRHVDARVDVYALGAVTYEMLAGEPPFTGPTVQAIIARAIVEEPRPLTTQRRSLPAHVDEAVQTALAKIPADRFDSAAQFAAALAGPDRAGSRRATHRRSGQRRRLALAAGALLLVATLGWLAVELGPFPRSRTDAAVVAFHQRGVRSYDRRTPAGIVEAVQAFAGALARDSNYAPAWTGLAKTYVRANERAFAIPGVPRDSVLPLAIAALDRALAADSANTEAWVTRAIVSRKIDPTDNSVAIRALRHAVEHDTTSASASAWHYLALSLAETGDFPAAMKAWRRSVALDPSFTMGLTFLAQGHYWRRQYDSAAVWIDSALVIDPKYFFARSLTGYVAVQRGDFARAADAFDAARLLTDEVEVAHTLAGMATAHARAGRRPQAEATLRRADSLAARFTPPVAHTAVWLAEGHVALDDIDGALAWLGRYERPRDLHFQLHLRCDPGFDAVARNARFRSLLTTPRPRANGAC